MAIVVPGAELHLSNPISTRPVLPWWIYCHTIVGTVDGAISGRHYHLYVRGDGSFVQRQDLALRSAASVEMNPYSIAIVAEDKGPMFPAWTGSNVPPYTPQQVKTLILVIGWICRRFGIPTNAVRTSCLNEAHGVAWHRLGIDGDFPNQWPYWGRQPGCLETSLSTGKPCPGNARITQIVNDIVPALTVPEDDMTPDQAKQLTQVLAQTTEMLKAMRTDPNTAGSEDRLGRNVQDIHDKLGDVYTQTTEILKALRSDPAKAGSEDRLGLNVQEIHDAVGKLLQPPA